MKDLESCPICGKPPRWSRHNDRDHAQLSCIGTDHAVSGAWGVEEEAVRTWNRRATASENAALKAKVARLEAVRVTAKIFYETWEQGQDGFMGSIPIAEALEDALQAVPSDEPATSYAIAVNETGSDEQQVAAGVRIAD